MKPENPATPTPAQRLKALLPAFGLFAAGAAYGAMVHARQWFPYSTIAALYKPIHARWVAENPVTAARRNDMFTKISADYWKTDLKPLLAALPDAAAVPARRAEAVKFLWGGAAPTRLPDLIQVVTKNDPALALTPLGKLERWRINMEFGLVSFCDVMRPKRPVGGVALLHMGHSSDWLAQRAFVSRLLTDGRTVVILRMPLMGPNWQPLVTLPGHGRLRLQMHDQLKLLRPKTGHPLKFFIEPTVIALNQLVVEKTTGPVVMTGLGGGGWSTIVAAALDARIEASYPVSGAYPIFLRSESALDWKLGEWEQTVPEFYERFNYLELFLLGAGGRGRRQIQIINQFDPAHPSGVKGVVYRDFLREKMASLGEGRWDLVIDDSHAEHIISPAVQNRILADFPKN